MGNDSKTRDAICVGCGAPIPREMNTCEYCGTIQVTKSYQEIEKKKSNRNKLKQNRTFYRYLLGIPSLVVIICYSLNYYSLHYSSSHQEFLPPFVSMILIVIGFVAIPLYFISELIYMSLLASADEA